MYVVSALICIILDHALHSSEMNITGTLPEAGKFEAYHHQTPARKNMRGHRRSIDKSRSKTVKNKKCSRC